MELPAESLAWTALLARWTELAAASRAWPGGEGARWRASVPAAITLQAVTHALRELESLPAGEWPVARDMAEVQVTRALESLREIWPEAPLPEALQALVDAAGAALRRSLYAGLEEYVWEGPGTWVVPPFEPGPPAGTLAAMAPGTIVYPGEPVAWWTGRPAPEIPACRRAAGAEPRQVYRLFDERGRWIGRATVPVEEHPPAGMPLLIPLSLQGEAIGRFLHPPGSWESVQRAAGIGAAEAPGPSGE